MAATTGTARDIFLAALDRPPAERPAYLDEACAGDPALRQRVEALLRANEEPGAFLSEARPELAADATVAYRPDGEIAGTVIAGKYKLLQQIGEGGMGSVWMADQTEPVKRRVALKLIRVERGQSKTILSRFEAERQAIALMDHPHIARLLDAGTTDAGQPYFVMELVKGVPLTEFCDAHKLSIPERLQLFMQVCSAVQHAHQKGIIHRDLKPTNILVESHDGKPVPKVIDFGLAKATTGLQLTEHTLFTAFGSVMGTPLYMAPEQANFNAIDVDTRADIYALGVILYELLTGSTPLSRETVKKAALDEMLRLIREQEAPTPSSRLSSSESKPSVAANRQMEPARLGRFVRGELDWIVMKALEKDRNRRYETANGFAADICRYLVGEPVLAVPPTFKYRVRKAYRKNRPAVLVASAFAAVLLLSTGVSVAFALQARQAEYQAQQDRDLAMRREAEARESERTATHAIETISRSAFSVGTQMERILHGPDYAQRKALDHAEPLVATALHTRPLLEAQVRLQLGYAYLNLQESSSLDPEGMGDNKTLNEKALSQFARAHALVAEHAGSDQELIVQAENAHIYQYFRNGRSSEAIALQEQAFARRRQTLGETHPQTLALQAWLISSYCGKAGGGHWPEYPTRKDDARKLAEELWRIQRRMDGFYERVPHGQLMSFANAYEMIEMFAEEDQTLAEALEVMTSRYGPDDNKVIGIEAAIAGRLADRGHFNEAANKLELLLARSLEKQGYKGQTTGLVQWLHQALDGAGRYEEIVRLLTTAIPEFRKAEDRNLYYEFKLGDTYLKLGRYREFVALTETRVARMNARERSDFFKVNDPQLNPLLRSYVALGETAKARKLAADVEVIRRLSYPPGSVGLAAALATWSLALIEAGMYADGERLAREVLALREQAIPNTWWTANARALVGFALLRQKRDAEAEPMLAVGYEGLRARKADISASNLPNLTRAGWALVLLYERTDRPEKAATVRTELGPETLSMPRAVTR